MATMTQKRMFSDGVEREIKTMGGYCPHYWNGAEAVPYSQQDLGRCPLFDSKEEVFNFFKKEMKFGHISDNMIRYFEVSEFIQ